MKKSSDTNTILTVERQRKFSKRAGQYMLPYHATNILKNKDIETDNESSNKMSHTLLEKAVKIFKTHRNAAESD